MLCVFAAVLVCVYSLLLFVFVVDVGGGGAVMVFTVFLAVV